MPEINHEIEQAIRNSHCAFPFKDTHPCIGHCTITPKGTELECVRCGDGDYGIKEHPKYQTLTNVLRKIHIEIHMIDIHIVVQMLRELEK